MDAAQVVSAILGSAGGAGVLYVLLTFVKRKPGQREKDEVAVEAGHVNVAEGYINIARGTVNFVTETYEEQFTRMNATIVDLRREFDQYRQDSERRHAELAAALRSKKAENERLESEKVELEDRLQEQKAEFEQRISDLEAEVERLKRTSTTTTTTKTDTTPESTTTKTDVTTSDVKRVEE